MPEGEYLDLSQASRSEQVSTRTLYRLVERGALQLYRKPGCRRSYVKTAELKDVMQPRPVSGQTA